MRVWIWMKCRVSCTNWLTFEPSPDYSLDARTGLLSPISYKRWYVEFYVGENPTYTYCRGPPHCFKLVLFTQPAKHLCQRYMRTTECPSSYVLISISADTRSVRRNLLHKPCSVLLEAEDVEQRVSGLLESNWNRPKSCQGVLLPRPGSIWARVLWRINCQS